MFSTNIYPAFYNRVSFTSSTRNRKADNPQILKDTDKVYNTTCLLRNDIDWFYLARFLKDNFKNKDKVNIYDFACSDGSEAYSMAIALNEVIKVADERNKFLPIWASDIDSDIIKLAKSGKINLHDCDIKRLDAMTTCRYPYFTDPDFSIPIENEENLDIYKSYRPNAYLKYAVAFKTADILQQLKNIEDDGNTVILCRNVFPYLKSEYVNQVIKYLNQKLKPNSVLVLGNFDNCCSYREKLLENFECIDNNIYKKRK